MIQRAIIGMLSLLIVFFATCGDQYSPAFLGESEVVASSNEESSDEQEDQKSNSEEYKLMAYEAVLPLLQANFSPLQYTTVFRVTVVIENIIEEEREFHLPFVSYFNTLFRLIISPNAP